jgi:hypothetical protein
MPNDRPIGETRWHDNEELEQAIMLRLALLVRWGRVEEAQIQSRPDLFVTAVCEALAGCVATMPAVQRAMKVAHPSLDGTQRAQEVIKKMAELFGISPDSMLEALTPKAVEPRPTFIPPRDPTVN